jgi:hypothetical protein
MSFKINAAKSDGVVTAIKMYMCINSMSTTKNSLYVGQSFEGGKVNSTTSLGVSSGGVSANLRAVATGTLNSSNQWTSKQITSNASFATGASGDHYSAESVLTQNTSTVALSTYRSASFSSTNATAAAYAVVQSLNASKMATFALGDGSAKASFTYGGSSVTANATAAVSWNGDTLLNLSDSTTGDNYAAANAGTLPTGITGSATMPTAETWDCTAGAGGFTAPGNATGDGSADLANCQTQYPTGGDSSNIDCHTGT